MSSSPADPFIPLSVPEIRGREWQYVKQCLDTGWISSVGEYVTRFEQQCASACGSRFAVATCNGTAALHIALKLAGVQPDDEVLVSTLTFIATANAVRYCGAWPVFIDAEPRYWQMDVEKVADFLRERCVRQAGRWINRDTGRRVWGVLPVHVMGHSVDLDPLAALMREHELGIVEDAAEAMGCLYRDQPVGARSGVGCLSFNGNKILTTGGGGMIVTNDETLARRAKHLTTQAKADAHEYIHDELGYNYRMTNLAAAVGVAQLEQLDAFVAAKRAIADRYARQLPSPHVTLMPEAPWCRGTFWLYTILVRDPSARRTSRGLMQHLASKQIQARPLWQPMHLSPVHRECQAYRIEVADDLYAAALSLPCSVGLSEHDQARVVREVRAYLE
jgi:perosamine synthetase